MHLDHLLVHPSFLQQYLILMMMVNLIIVLITNSLIMIIEKVRMHNDWSFKYQYMYM